MKEYKKEYQIVGDLNLEVTPELERALWTAARKGLNGNVLSIEELCAKLRLEELSTKEQKLLEQVYKKGKVNRSTSLQKENDLSD